MSPCISRASRRLIASPRPEPSLGRVCPDLTCTNGSKMRESWSAGMPVPLSVTRK
jgi:hypothetical protein